MPAKLRPEPYLPNGNPAPGPKFDYKLRWFDRLTGYAQSLLAQ